MRTEDNVRDEKLQYDIDRGVAKILALSFGKIDKYECLTDEEIVPFNQRQIIEQSKFAYSRLAQAFEKQTEKQVDTIKYLDPANKLKEIEGIFPQNLMNYLIRAKLKKIVELQNIIEKGGLKDKSKVEKLIILVNIHYLLFL